MDEVLHALSTKYYKSDRKVKQTIASVVMSTAETGSVIIVGRAAVAVTRNLKKGIHLKLYAPIEWRVSSLMKRYHATREQIIKDIHRLDLVRHKLVKDYLKPNVNVDELYDLQINTSSVSHKEIVGMVIKLMEDRGLFNH
jgi:cytidylate kinase